MKNRSSTTLRGIARLQSSGGNALNKQTGTDRHNHYGHRGSRAHSLLGPYGRRKGASGEDGVHLGTLQQNLCCPRLMRNDQVVNQQK